MISGPILRVGFQVGDFKLEALNRSLLYRQKFDVFVFSRGVSRQNVILEDPAADSATSAPDPTPPEVGSHPRCLALASLQDDGTSGNLTPSNYIILLL